MLIALLTHRKTTINLVKSMVHMAAVVAGWPATGTSHERTVLCRTTIIPTLTCTIATGTLSKNVLTMTPRSSPVPVPLVKSRALSATPSRTDSDYATASVVTALV